MKYKIKNCPAFNKYTQQCRGAYERKIKFQYCSGNNEENCPLKQIVELCKENLAYCDCDKTYEYFDEEHDCFELRCEASKAKVMAKKILKLLEIEVIND